MQLAQGALNPKKNSQVDIKQAGWRIKESSCLKMQEQAKVTSTAS